MRTYPGDGLDEAGLARALIADDDDAGELDVDVRAVVWGKRCTLVCCGTSEHATRGLRSWRTLYSPQRAEEPDELDELARALGVVRGAHEGLVLRLLGWGRGVGAAGHAACWRGRQ